MAEPLEGSDAYGTDGTDRPGPAGKTLTVSSLPLFPLGTVLLPGARLPLVIFEPRYVELLRRLDELPADERCFGVIAIKRGHEVGVGRAEELHSVGCEAVLESVRAGVQQGRPVYQVVVRGTRVFRLVALRDADQPYAVGDVEWLKTDRASPTGIDELCGELRRAHADYLAALGVAPVDLDASPSALGYAAVGASRLPLADRQSVLAEPDAAERLRLVSRLLMRERALVDRFDSVPFESGPGAALN